MRFCNTWDSKLIKTEIDEKCPKCDKNALKKIEDNKKNKVKTQHRYSQEDFPFEKNQHYLQKEVRKSLRCSLMSEINYNREGNFLVIFMNAHDPKKIQNNPYQDHYDSKTGLYHYTGRGKKGNQTLTGVNEYLNKSNETNTIIHFFVQSNIGSNHKYIGKVKLEKVVSIRYILYRNPWLIVS